MSSTARRCPTAHPARKKYTPSSTWRHLGFRVQGLCQLYQRCSVHVVMLFAY